MVTFDAFRLPDGNIDWTAYNLAKREAGESCTSCNGPIVWGSGRPSQCSDCEHVREDGELHHPSRLRCPKCRHAWSPYDGENWGVLSTDDSEHDVNCPRCDHLFAVRTHVTYSFTSPAMGTETEE